MPNILAIANCRVSSEKQLKNHSLSRQKKAVLKAAKDLGVTIPDDGWWSGNVSSLRGKNINRKDLEAMIKRCKKDKRIKYLIVDEPDRFMRSIDEAAYFEVTFRQLGVTVWYASDPDLNKGDLAAKLLKFTKYLSAEGSNEERQRKSINGQVNALREGRYPFAPKPGYKKGTVAGVQEVHPLRGPILKEILEDICTGRTEPAQALVKFNNSEFMKGHSPYKMDKFRKIVTDPFYAGIVDVDKQVKVRNEKGLHKALIKKDTHYKILKIMNSKEKCQSGPRKNGNSKYPCNNMVSCDLCHGKSNIGRVVGFDHGNGKPNSKVWEKYRCRGCGRYWTRQELHDMVEQQFKDNPVTPEGRDDFLEALNIVWKQHEGEAEQEAAHISHKISTVNKAISEQVEAATDPDNASIKHDILAAIASKKDEVAKLEDQLTKLKDDADSDKEEFLRFAFIFLDNMGSRFLDPSLSYENRLRCKQIVFPAGFWLDENKKVYTPEISPLYRLVATKKGALAPNITQMVRVKRL